MKTRRSFWSGLAALPLLSAFSGSARAEPDPAPTSQPGMEMLTIFLRHDETKTVDAINEHLKETGWFDHFRPPGVEVVSWYVMMGIGQVVTIRFPAERLRDVNRLIEGEAWGGYRTEFYPTYDYRALYGELQVKMRKR
ncbi:hypothetical protein [Beijerinckia sp. L45]|uniref:hypothetical protein n=1 Tax=Beijerinckia sp. L45 TaxID=1641855 RepID=UPI00131A6B6F|nr:hypothetical protein [Beijerinckia sp. L45]